MKKKTDDYRQILEQWRNDCHKKIDNFIEQKYQDINQRVTEKVKKQREEIDQIQKKIATLIREEEVSRQDINTLTSSIQKLEQEIKRIERTHLNRFWLLQLNLQ